MQSLGDVEDIAEEGREKGYGPAKLTGDFETHFRSANQAYLMTGRIGGKFPSVEHESEERKKLAVGHEFLSAALEKVEKEARTSSTLATPVAIPDRPADCERTPDPLSAAPENGPPGDHKTETPGPPAPARKRRRKGLAKELLAAALDSLAARGDWGKTDAEIIGLADISRDSFYFYSRRYLTFLCFFFHVLACDSLAALFRRTW